MRKIIVVMGIVLLLIAAFVIFYILYPAGTFKTIKPHFIGTQSTLTLPVPGPEDILIDRDSNQLLISADDRRANLLNPGSVRGALYVYDLITHRLTELDTRGIVDFHPHGISMWKNDSGKRFLFVINHLSAEESAIERFEWTNDSLVHLESISDSNAMTHPNDLAAVNERQFYVTNDHYYTKGLQRKLEEYLQRKISFVNYYDGTHFRVVAENIGYANGINASQDRNTIFVSSTTGLSVLVYERSNDGSLDNIDEIHIGTGPDNIDIDREGNLFIACHPQLLKFVAHAKDPKNVSPSQVIKIQYQSVGEYSVEEVFLNDGEYSGSSTAISHNTSLIIGSVFEQSILMCTPEK